MASRGGGRAPGGRAMPTAGTVGSRPKSTAYGGSSGAQKDVEIVKAPFGTFSVGARIGRGAYAQVYKALWNDTGFYVAIKMFDTTQMTQETVDSVLVEVTLLGRLKHPNILRILGYHRESENLYLMLEYAENGSLLKLVKDLGRIPEDITCTYVRQVLMALAYLHEAGIIHRDLKAANILLNGKGDVKLADFGVAAVIDESDKHFTVVGSPYWMAPEIIQATGHSTQSDIWSLGCTVIELLTGEPPHFGLNPMTAMFKIVQSPAPIPKDVSKPLYEFLEACFQKDPNLRPPASVLLKNPLFVKPLVANMDVAAIKARVLGERGAASGSGSASKGSGPLVTSMSSGSLIRSPSTSSNSGSYSGGLAVPASPISRLSGSLRTRDRRDSRVPIPEYVRVDESSKRDDDDEEEEDSSDSETSRSHGTGSEFVLQRKQDPKMRSSATMQNLNPLSDISITVDRTALANKLGTSGGMKGRTPTASTRQIPANDPRFKSMPPGFTGSASERVTSSGPSKKGERLTHEEETALEVEALTQQLMALEKNGFKISEETKLVTGSVRSTKAEFLQQLTPSLHDAGGSAVTSVCCMTVINNVLWIGSATGSVATFQLPRFEPLKVARIHKTRVSCIIAVGSSRVWCSSEDGEIYVISHHDPSRFKSYPVHDAEHKVVRCLAYVPGDRARVWSCAISRKSSQIVVLTKHCQVKYKLAPIEQQIQCLTLGPSQVTVWIGMRGTMIVCDALHGDQKHEKRLRDVKGATEALHTQHVTQILPVGDLIWCAVGKHIIVIDPTKYEIERTLVLESEVTCLAIFESAVLAGTADSKIECFDSISMARMRTLPTLLSDASGRVTSVSSLATIPGSLLAGRTGVAALFAGSLSSGKICVWTTPT